MTTQPEALRLANHLDLFRSFPDDLAAAAELRRLHQSEREGWRYADELEQERKRLYAINQELLEALKATLPFVVTQSIGCHGYKCREPWCWSCCGEEDAEAAAQRGQAAHVSARAAIAKAEGRA